MKLDGACTSKMLRKCFYGYCVPAFKGEGQMAGVISNSQSTLMSFVLINLHNDSQVG